MITQPPQPSGPEASLEGRPRVVINLLIIVLLLPPAPAARVLAGLLAAALSARSAAAFRRIAVFGPPGGVGDEGRAVLEPVDSGGLTGELGVGDDYRKESVRVATRNQCNKDTQLTANSCSSRRDVKKG